MIFDNILDQETFIDAFNLYNISVETYEGLSVQIYPCFHQNDISVNDNGRHKENIKVSE